MVAATIGLRGSGANRFRLKRLNLLGWKQLIETVDFGQFMTLAHVEPAIERKSY